jgi:formiminotetrahydrofolate cyclodeaminase
MRYQELLDAIRNRHDKIGDQFGEIFEDDEEAFTAIDRSLEDWADYFIRKSRENKANAEAVTSLARIYTERARAFDKQEEYYKAGIYTLVQMAGKPIKTVAGNASIQQGRLSVKLNCSAEELPEQYRKVEYAADTAALKKDLEAGKELNYASFKRGDSFLVIR